MGAPKLSVVSSVGFDYAKAFSRNLGWITPEEQQVLRQSTIGIAGLGGVGGFYCESLARLGVGKFVIADFDEFEIHNFNRQMGASISSLGKKKAEVLRDRILDINPEASVHVYTGGLQAGDIDAFVASIDLYIDALDFYVYDLRTQLIPKIQAAGKYSITAAPLGMGTSLIVFGPKSMSFNKYFRLHEGKSELEKALRFLLGLAPSMMHRKALAFQEAVDMANHKVPSTNMGCFLCAGVAVTTALKVLLKRGPILEAPWVLHFDAYLNQTKKTYTPFGNGFWINKIKIWVIKKILKIS